MATNKENVADFVEQVGNEKMGGDAVNEHTADLMAVAIKESRLKIFSVNSLKFFAALFVVYCNSWGTGFDSSLFGGLNSNERWNDHFNIPNPNKLGPNHPDFAAVKKKQGEVLGEVGCMITVGYIVGSFIAGPAADRWGRRWGMWIGSVILLVGAIIMSTAPDRSTFMGGRLLIGAGASVCSAAAGAWVAESSPPQWRGPTTYFFNTLYLPGAILASGIATATGPINSDWSWRIPVLVQIAPSAIVLFLVLFIPESPRWLVLNDRVEEAKAYVTKYHGGGDPDAPIVALQMFEIQQSIQLNASDKRWWDYSEFFSTRANKWRLFQVLSMAFTGQWGGQSSTGYYQKQTLSLIGITAQSQLLTYNMLYYVAAFVSAVFFTATSNHMGRRVMLLIGHISMAVILMIIAICTATFSPDQSGHKSRFTIAAIFFVGISHAGAINPLVIAFPAEVLNNSLRGKGMGINQFAVHAAEVVNTYAVPIAMTSIAWWTYVIFTIWNVVNALWVFFFFVETKGRTLEEMDHIFEAKNPVKESLRKRTPIDQVLREQGGAA